MSHTDVNVRGSPTVHATYPQNFDTFFRYRSLSRSLKLGIIPVQDKESKKTLWVNTSFGDFRNRIREHHGSRDKELADFSRKHQINFVTIDTDENYVPKLLKLFKVRNKSVKSA